MKKLSILLVALFIFTSFYGMLPESAGAQPPISDAIPVCATPNHNILDEAVFFGDSTTYGLLRYNVHNNGEHGKNYYTLKASQIWVPKEGTFYLGNLTRARIAMTDGRLLSLSEACDDVRPRYMIITVGINGLRTWTQENFSKYYEKMLEMIREASPETTVILQGVYPTALNRGEDLKDFTVEKIDAMNVWIADIARKYDLQYLDTASCLKDSDGYLCKEYQNGDGLHLNTLGFNAVLSYIYSHVQ